MSLQTIQKNNTLGEYENQLVSPANGIDSRYCLHTVLSSILIPNAFLFGYLIECASTKVDRIFQISLNCFC